VAGSATITATTAGKAGSATISVASLPAPPPPSGATPVVYEDFSTYSSTANMIADPRGIYSRPFEINVPVTDAGTINSQAIVAGNIYTITGTGTRFTSEIPSAGYVVSTGATKIRVNSVANDLQFTGTAITTGTLAGAYAAPVSPFLDLVLDKTVGYGGRTQSLRFDEYDRTDQGGSGTTGRCTALARTGSR
jgi:hypothetical protein